MFFNEILRKMYAPYPMCWVLQIGFSSFAAGARRCRPSRSCSMVGGLESGKIPRQILVDLFFGVVVQGPKISCGGHNVTRYTAEGNTFIIALRWRPASGALPRLPRRRATPAAGRNRERRQTDPERCNQVSSCLTRRFEGH